MTVHRRRLRWPAWLRHLRLETAGVVALLIGAAAVGSSMTQQESATEAAVDQANAVADPILVLCAQGGDTARKLADAGLCETAARVKTNPVTAASPTRVGEDRILGLVRAELARQLRPESQPPSMVEVIAAARAVIVADPELFRGEPGQPPSNAQVASVVSSFVAANPGLFRGEPGRDGDEGQRGERGVDGKPGPVGPSGPTCPAGTSLRSVTFADGQAGRGCVDEEPAATVSATPQPETPSDPSEPSTPSLDEEN